MNDIRSLGVMRPIFIILERAGGLSLKPLKCVLVPLATRCTPHTHEILRQWLASHCPAWAQLEIKGSARCLGFILGPEAGESCWDLPLTKFKRAPPPSWRRLPLLSSPRRCSTSARSRSFSLWAGNKIVRFPFGVVHVGAAPMLADVGCLNFTSASDACWSALVRVAVAGKVLWRDMWDLMYGSAADNLPFIRSIAELPWGAHWSGPAFAANLRDVSLG